MLLRLFLEYLHKLYNNIFLIYILSNCDDNGTCSVTAVVKKDKEEEKAYQFRMRLIDSMFGVVRSSIIQKEPVPKIKLVFAMVTKDEQHWTISKIVVADDRIISGTTFVVKSGQNRPTCNHCLKLGHEAANCFQLIRFPEWWPSEKNRLTRGGSGAAVPAGTTASGRGWGSLREGRDRWETCRLGPSAGLTLLRQRRHQL